MPLCHAFVARPACSGPAVREALSKDRKKDSGGGEDQWLLKPTNAWGLEGAEGGNLCADGGILGIVVSVPRLD